MHTFKQYLQPLDARAVGGEDQAFLQQLYASTRDDLRQFPGNPAMIASLIAMQQNMQAIGYRNCYPDALHLILEFEGSAIGRVMVDFAAAEIRLVDISLLPQARNQGFGRSILHALQQSAGTKNLPLALTVNKNNPHARRLYLALGFQVCQDEELAEQMVWRCNIDARPTARVNLFST